MSREEILKAIEICAQTDVKEDCNKECPCFTRCRRLQAMLYDMLELPKNRETIEAVE